MAEQSSFDISCSCDQQEVVNAVRQAQKEITQRYDFKGLDIEVDFDKAEDRIVLRAPDHYKLESVWDVLMSKLIKRGIPIKNIKRQEPTAASGQSVRQHLDLQQGISQEVAKEIVKFVKEQKLKKVQASVQKDQVRVQSPSRDDLQTIMSLLKAEDFGIALQFGNYR